MFFILKIGVQKYDFFLIPQLPEYVGMILVDELIPLFL